MKTVKISLNSIDKVKAFVNDVTKFNTDFDLVSGRYVIDAKSIMGIFSLDLSLIAAHFLYDRKVRPIILKMLRKDPHSRVMYLASKLAALGARVSQVKPFLICLLPLLFLRLFLPSHLFFPLASFQSYGYILGLAL